MQEAINLVKNQRAELRFIHVIDTYIPTLDMSGDINLTYLASVQLNRGKKILQAAVMGSDAKMVVRLIKIPVLLVK